MENCLEKKKTENIFILKPHSYRVNNSALKVNMKHNSQPISIPQCDMLTCHSKSRVRFDWLMTTGCRTSDHSHTRMPPESPTFEGCFFNWDVETEGLACFQEHLNASQWYHFWFKFIIIYSNCHFNTYIKINWHWTKKICPFWFLCWLQSLTMQYKQHSHCRESFSVGCRRALGVPLNRLNLKKPHGG